MTGSTATVLNTPSFLFLIFSLLSTSTHGKDVVLSGTMYNIDIVPVTGAVYGRIGSKFYVVGGGSTQSREDKTISATDQIIVLDLSASWDAANPPWRRLMNGPMLMNFTGAFSADGSKLITFSSVVNMGSASLYDFDKSIWSSSKVAVPDPNFRDLSAVTDPTTDDVYLPFGDLLYAYNFKTDNMTSISMSTSPLTKSMYCKGVWWRKKRSILYFGGYTLPNRVAPDTVFMYTPSTNFWSILPTRGTGPSGRTGMCIAISDNGNMLIVSGGFAIDDTGSQASNLDIYTLDLDTLVWTRDTIYPVLTMHSACTLYNDTFLSWGGVDSSSSIDGSMIIYDVRSRRHLSKYPVSLFVDSDLSDRGSQDPGFHSSSSSVDSTGAMIGILFCAVLGSVFLVWATRHIIHTRNRLKNYDSGDEDASGNSITYTFGEVIGTGYHNPSLGVMAEPSKSYHGQHSPTTLKSPQQGNQPISQKAPQNMTDALPGYMMAPELRGPEAISNVGNGMNLENSIFWLDLIQEIDALRSPHLTLPNTPRSPQQWGLQSERWDE
ncbi:MAG: hypothetical protein J3Q66DRAFT_424086 [Benniella sp.]|nr:MAG: hypothetical protein J3Q66DRAFT_424086 [Benniella sp.]